MAASNHGDVLHQLHAGGLQVEYLEMGRIVRCRIDGDGERRGWYILHELQGSGGDLLIFGSFGQWHGQDNGAQKIQLAKTGFNAEQRAAIRHRVAQDRKLASRQHAALAAQAAEKARRVWEKCDPTGDSPYLTRKGVQAHGLRFAPSGACVVPMLDVAGTIHGLHVIRPTKHKGRDKDFWPAGVAKKGHFHLIGMPAGVVLVAEGYATAATLHEATGLPVATAFDAGNLAPVAVALHKRYRRARILICADDDPFSTCIDCKACINLADAPQGSDCEACGKPHGRSNTGVDAASTAALAVDGAWIVPAFNDPDERRRLFFDKGIRHTDFNDLHATAGLHVVRTQIEARLTTLAWPARPATRPRATTHGQEGRSALLKPIETLDELLERFWLVYGEKGIVFDRQLHRLISLSDMRDACMVREIARAWQEHPDRKIVAISQVGFDPACKDPDIRCNLWGGWPTTPKEGECDKLLGLLRYMCSADGAPETLYGWVLNWLAYPIQHPGAKLRTCLVLHGPQGTGKNLFFEAVMAIYGHYGRIIDQAAIDDSFNDWASRKLFFIADEVIARSDIYQVKNKLKSLITGEWIHINPKGFTAYYERNHINMVFLSNEDMPLVLEEDDRRHAVIWTPEKQGHEVYRAVLDEMDTGGVAALHHYLLHHDTSYFDPGQLPPYTDAKDDLINLGLDSTSRFHAELVCGNIQGVKLRPALSTDVYDLYRAWCGRTGQRAAPMPRLIHVLVRKHHVISRRKRYTMTAGNQGPHSVLYLGKHDLPPGESESIWLGKHINHFRQSVRKFKGETYDESSGSSS